MMSPAVERELRAIASLAAGAAQASKQQGRDGMTAFLTEIAERAALLLERQS